MASPAPIVAAIPDDASTEEVVTAAAELARRMRARVIPVHALAPYPFPTARHDLADAAEARTRLNGWLAYGANDEVEISELVVEESEAAALVLDVAARNAAQMIVTGTGRGATIGQWLLGSTADRIVRHAHCPVFLARGALPGMGRGKIVCPVDLSPHAHLGFAAALRMARLFEAPLLVVTAVPAPRDPRIAVAKLVERAEELEARTRRELETLIGGHDIVGLEVAVDVVAGDPATVILDAASSAQLVVVGSRSFDHLVPFSMGNVTERVVRGARCSVLCVRDDDPEPERRERAIGRVALLRREAKEAASAGELDRAESLLTAAAALLPGNAALQEDLAEVVEAAGRANEAERRRALAALLRKQLG